MSMRYWLDTSDDGAVLPHDSTDVAASRCSEADPCNARATVRGKRPSDGGEIRSAVRPSDGLTPSDGQLPHPGPVRSLTAPPRLNPTAFAAVVTLATRYSLTAPGYLALHARIRRERGPASARACWRCGRRARVWSCTAPPGDRIRGVSGSGSPAWYSLDPEAYRPACSRCAALDDREHADARRATAHLAVSPLPKRPDRAPAPPPTAPEPPALFDLVDGEMTTHGNPKARTA